MGKTTEYRRTCSRDGVVWYVTGAEAKPVSRLERTAVAMMQTGNALSLRKPKAGVELVAQSQKTREDLARCPVCGSREFEQTKG